MITQSYPARSCGNKKPHPEHIWVEPGDKAYACFGRSAS